MVTFDELKALADDTDVGLRATAGYVDADGPLDPVREALVRLVAAVRAVVPIIVVVAAVTPSPAAPATAACPRPFSHESAVLFGARLASQRRFGVPARWMR